MSNVVDFYFWNLAYQSSIFAQLERKLCKQPTMPPFTLEKSIFNSYRKKINTYLFSESETKLRNRLKFSIYLRAQTKKKKNSKSKFFSIGKYLTFERERFRAIKKILKIFVGILLSWTGSIEFSSVSILPSLPPPSLYRQRWITTRTA